jgi:hypothetical protein
MMTEVIRVIICEMQTVSKSGLFPRLGSSRVLESDSNVPGKAAKGKTAPLGICGIRTIRLQVPGFPCARPRMCRLEVWVAASL